jgi:hypothetical protein
VAAATLCERVVPVAVLLGKGKSLDEAHAVLRQHPILRNAIASATAPN